jgi:predicted Zn-dependent protease
MVGGLINMRYGREDELEAERLGVCLMQQAGNKPAALIDVMRILAGASGGAYQPEFASSYPCPVSRVQQSEYRFERLAATCSFRS